MKKISNPLTIIGIFAGISEISGTIVLPSLEPDLQKIFIWYVIAFPVLLVVVFFITLNFNPKVLYGPGDFSNEDSFLKLIGKRFRRMEQEYPQLSEELASLENEICQLHKARK